MSNKEQLVETIKKWVKLDKMLYVDGLTDHQRFLEPSFLSRPKIKDCAVNICFLLQTIKILFGMI